MAEFLDTFDVERQSLLGAVDHLEEVWARFQERRALDMEGTDLSDSLIASEIALVKKELMARQFTVGIFGLIKRGKSTLLNALVGREVSSMHVTPETAVPVYVDYGEVPQADVYFADGSVRHVALEEVSQFTSQKHNAGNKLGVAYVHQSVPVRFLRNGTRLIDTPGLDDADADEVYTERTMQELDLVDAGVVVFLSPPTVGATEMSFLEEIVSRNLKNTFLVCNMYPQHFYDADTRNAVLEYVGRRILEASVRAGNRGEVRVYPVCALEAWDARMHDDIDKWKRSGADRVLRELELYLSEVAGAQTLFDAAERVSKAAEMAQSEVKVRQRLLADPERLAQHRSRVDENVRELEHQFEDALAVALTDIAPLKMRIRSLLRQPFGKARKTLEGIRSLQELEKFSDRFRREMEVAGEVASRNFLSGYEHVVEKLQRTLEDRFHAVMTDLSPNLPEVRFSPRGLLMSPDQVRQLQRAEQRSRTSAMGGAAFGGLVAGSGAVLLASAALGPLGLIGGALVGWKLSGLLSGASGVDRARQAIIERLNEIADQLARDFDAQVDHAVESLRAAVVRRRHAFAADLYQQFDLVESLASDPAMLESYGRDAERFLAAFDACASRARNAISFAEPISA